MQRSEHGEPRDTAGEDLHGELLSGNLFVITMVGAVAFSAACFYILFA